MNQQKRGHHIILIIFLMILLIIVPIPIYLGFINGGISLYFILTAIALIVGACSVFLFNETTESKNLLTGLILFGNIGLSIMGIFHWIANTIINKLQEQANHFLAGNNGGVIDMGSMFRASLSPHLVYTLIFIGFNIVYVIHIVQEKQYKRLLWLLIPIVIYIAGVFIAKTFFLIIPTV